jgi:uncharacterized protein YbgA (DUF1722 family)/uncharacterized protein YbbK (DUF523 family)
LRLGVSRCLLGDEVRFDGQHKRDPFLAETLAPFVSWVPVCPELEAGMGVPREPVRLVADTRRGGGALRVVGTTSGADHTAALEEHAQTRVATLAQLELAGFVLKKDSPSCGLFRVRIHSAERGAGDVPSRTGRGVFATALCAALPQLPVEEEGRLHDPVLRENFIERLFAHQRLRVLFSGRWTRAELVAFHTAHKLTVLAHATEAYRRLGRLVAGQKGEPAAALAATYQEQFMAALARPTTRGRHRNVLDHMAGYLRDRVDAAGRAEVGQAIADYAAGLLPLIVPITLLRHHVRAAGIDYLQGQTYLEPHPKELMLLNHV